MLAYAATGAAPRLSLADFENLPDADDGRLEAGVRLVWVVHAPSRTVLEYRSADDIRLLQQDDGLRAEDILPGFTCALNERFAPVR